LNEEKGPAKRQKDRRNIALKIAVCSSTNKHSEVVNIKAGDFYLVSSTWRGVEL